MQPRSERPNGNKRSGMDLTISPEPQVGNSVCFRVNARVFEGENGGVRQVDSSGLAVIGIFR